MLQRLCFILITFLLIASSHAHASSFRHVNQNNHSSQVPHNVGTIHVSVVSKSILLIDAVLYEPSSIANNVYVIEEFFEEDEDTECASLKKHSNNNTQFCISQKAFQKAGASHFYSPKSWQTQAPIIASTSTSKYVLFCVFRI